METVSPVSRVYVVFLGLVHNNDDVRACVVFVASVVLGSTQLDQGSI